MRGKLIFAVVIVLIILLAFTMQPGFGQWLEGWFK
jgi:hypothetical protein